jgi:hypothetical protein
VHVPNKQPRLLHLTLTAVPFLCVGGLLAAFLAAVRNRRVQAAVKYWGVLVIMMVGTLLLQYFKPVVARMNPTFGYTAVVVGMSDRVESTVFKVRQEGLADLWTVAAPPGHTPKGVLQADAAPGCMRRCLLRGVRVRCRLCDGACSAARLYLL